MKMNAAKALEKYLRGMRLTPIERALVKEHMAEFLELQEGAKKAKKIPLPYEDQQYALDKLKYHAENGEESGVIFSRSELKALLELFEAKEGEG